MGSVNMAQKGMGYWMGLVEMARNGMGRNGKGRDGTGLDLTGRDLTGRDMTGRDLTGRDFTGREGSGLNGKKLYGIGKKQFRDAERELEAMIRSTIKLISPHFEKALVETNFSGCEIKNLFFTSSR